MKLTTLIFSLTAALLLVGCGESQADIERKQQQEQIKENKKKFYYPIPYDDYWRTYDARLRKAEGWIGEHCNRIITDDGVLEGKKLKPYLNQRVTIVEDISSHDRWGTYKGYLKVKNDSLNWIVTIDYRSFKPDFETGEWLSTEYYTNP